MKLSDKMRANCPSPENEDCSCGWVDYADAVAKLERVATVAQVVAKRLEMIQLNGPFGAVPGWTLDLIEALKELEE